MYIIGVGDALQDEAQIMQILVQSALNYGKRYLYRALSDFLKDWSLDEFLEDVLFQ